MSEADPPRAATPALLAAVAMSTSAMLVLAGFLLYQAIAERNTLLINLGAQEQQLQQARQVKTQLDALASATARLADDGDKGAREIIDALKTQGIILRP